MKEIKLTDGEFEAVKTIVGGKVEYMKNFDEENMTEEGKEHYENLKSFYEKIKDEE